MEEFIHDGQPLGQHSYTASTSFASQPSTIHPTGRNMPDREQAPSRNDMACQKRAGLQLFEAYINELFYDFIGTGRHDWRDRSSNWRRHIGLSGDTESIEAQPPVTLVATHPVNHLQTAWSLSKGS